MSQIVKGTLIEWLSLEKEGSQPGQQSENVKNPLIERVVYINREEDYAMLISIDEQVKDFPFLRSLSELEDAIAQEFAFKRVTDPHVWCADPDPEYLAAHVHVRDRAWNSIKDIVAQEPDIYMSEQRGKLIRQSAEKYSMQPCEIYLYCRRWWKRGMIMNALLPSYNKCGGPGKERKISSANGGCVKRGRPPRLALVDHEMVGINIDEDTKKLIIIGYKLFYDGKKRSLKLAYELTCAKFFNVGFREENGVQVPILAPANNRPTLGQFSHVTRSFRRCIESIIKRETRKFFNLNYRATTGSSTSMARGPGAIFQIDATIGDIYLVSSLNFTWIIGRPVIYIAKDVFSRMVVGIYVGLEGPSWAGAMMAIVNATTDKVAYYAEHGITISYEDFPCMILCESWMSDRGEMISLDSDKLTSNLGMSVANCPPFRGDFKGIVEREFGTINEKVIKWTPGEVRKRAPGDRDYRHDAKLTLYEFTQLLLGMVLEYNKTHLITDYPMDRDLIRDNVLPIPINLWNWGVVHRSGQMRGKTPDVIRASLMPTGMATVTRSGIKFNGMHYTSERAERERWFDQAGYGKSWRIPVTYDKRLSDVIYMRSEDGALFEPCKLLEVDQHFIGTRHEEVEDYLAMKWIAADRHKDTQDQSSARRQAWKESIVRKATERTDAALAQAALSKHERISSIKEHRAEEKERNRQEEAFRLGQEPQDVTRSCDSGSGLESFQASQDDHLAEPLPDKKMALLDMLDKRNGGGKS